ncbi:MAG: hypothetical protein Q4F38_00595 [Akkermansia sp.]|nr:hypothetical protein [Akkermansia sp.]
MNYQLYIFDCLTGKLRVSDGSFMTIGKNPKSTFRVTMAADNGGVFAQRDGKCRFFPHSSLESYSLDGHAQSHDHNILPDSTHLFVLAGGCFICWYGSEENRPDFAAYRPRVWYIYTPETRAWSSAHALLDLPRCPEAASNTALAAFEGLGHQAFRLSDILSVADFVSRMEGAVQRAHMQGSTPKGKYRCPSCRATFIKEEALFIATHPSLCGDERLGPDAMQRFAPEVITKADYATDSRGSRCHERACPYCHHKLPPYFGQINQHIISLVGVPSAGRSYYLSSLVHELERTMPRDFGIPFRDADPTSNAPLNDMRMRVFTADSPQAAHLGKTHLSNSLYRKVWKDGAYINMPRPFIYTLSKGSGAHSIVFYNNRDGSEAQGVDSSLNHLKVADALFFLFDPTTNPEFRALLKNEDDPQLRNCLTPPGRQARLLADMEHRLRSALNLKPGQRVNTPLAIILGKSDAWRSLLGAEPLLPLVRNGQLKQENIIANSNRLRELLFRISPNICTNAEAVSDNVCYFAASAMGAAPVEFTDEETGDVVMGPASGSLNPFRVTDPLLWALSSLEPSLFPGTNS